MSIHEDAMLFKDLCRVCGMDPEVEFVKILQSERNMDERRAWAYLYEIYASREYEEMNTELVRERLSTKNEVPSS